jgi:hypothetical protein
MKAETMHFLKEREILLFGLIENELRRTHGTVIYSKGAQNVGNLVGTICIVSMFNWLIR